jgi:hypothetical protein
MNTMATSRKDPNFFPEKIGVAFQNELIDLVDQLAQSGGFKEVYLKSEILSKYCDSFTVSPILRRQAAIKKWLLAEDRNRKTNQRVPFGEDLGWCHTDILIAKARKTISRVLGPIVAADALCISSHTNGASTRLRRSEITAILKHSGKAHGTETARLQWSLLVSDTRLRGQTTETVLGSELFTVEKKTDIDRVACKEPEINLFLQRGVGNHIRRRLKSQCGIDLNDQTRNQELARLAVDRGLATIDLSSASDSISKVIVQELLPVEWWYYLDEIRVPFTQVDGVWHDLEMFSSMGNGFTFELESLIFYALTRAVCELSGNKGEISVYGDDIVAPSSVVPRLSRVFNWFGFTVNLSKSFWTGEFRESCGKHFHKGIDVSPFYLRAPISGKTDVIRLLNRLMEWSSRDWGFICDSSVAVFHQKWSARIPQHLWGGQDPDDVTSLVTGSPPQMRLIRKPRGIGDLLRSFGCSLADFENCRLDRWLTLKEVTLEEALKLDPTIQTAYMLVKQPEWLVRTSWTPYLVFPDATYPG